MSVIILNDIEIQTKVVNKIPPSYMSDSNILEKIWAYITEIMVYNDPQDPF